MTLDLGLKIMVELATWMAFLLFCAGVIVGIIYIYGVVKEKYDSFRNQSNKVLRELVDDLEKKCDGQEKEIKTLNDKIIALDMKVAELEKKNLDLHSIVTDALVKYFQEHPNIAQQLVSATIKV